MTPDQLSSITDVQLLTAISLLGGPAFSPAPPPATTTAALVNGAARLC